MYVVDGIAYAGEPVVGLKVADARIVNDLSMLVRFSTGETRLFDASTLVKKDAFRQLGDPRAFAEFVIEHGVLTWANGLIDIAPEALYDMSYRYDLSA